MEHVIEIEEKQEDKRANERQKLARYLLRTSKRNGTCISKESAKYLFADAGWEYNERDTHLNIPDE
ncbi:hypothetical protein D3C87_574210 [compost metagenome]